MDWWLAALAGGLGVGYWAGVRRRRVRAESAAGLPTEAPPTEPPVGTQEPPEEPARLRLLRRADELGEFYDLSAHPDDLTASAEWNRCVQELAGSDFTYDDVLGYLSGGSSLLATVAAHAVWLRAESEGRERELLRYFAGRSIYAGSFLLRALERVTDPDIVIDVLGAITPGWHCPLGVDLLRGFLRRRLEPGHVQAADRLARLLAANEGLANLVDEVLSGIDSPSAQALRDALAPGSSRHASVETLRRFARLLDAREPGALLPSTTQASVLQELAASVRADPARPVLLVGEPGVGKATLTAQVVARLNGEGWTVFEAGATQLLAGQSYIGQLEGRVLELVRAASGRPKTLWVAPGLIEFVSAGRHQFSPTGLLDLLLPYFTSGSLRLLAPMTPAAHEQLLRQVPALRAGSVAVRLPEAGAEETLALGRAWLANDAAGGAPLCDDDLLRELHQRAQQYLTQTARPGCLLSLLTSLRAQVVPTGAPRRAASIDDAITLLSRLTGLPASVLDDRAGLDLESLRRSFGQRVLGQQEAVDCLVERVAMLKAGLCDTRRPIGVFLFTGPTGTGKTELCRVLAEYLFGSGERMLRLDMSEFQHAEAIARLVGDADDVHGRQALVHRIREQPFAVVLLDEIEKAHPMVFDLFLQVFDEGRLTDRKGRLADFRHALVVMTSNLGVREFEGANLGFVAGAPTPQRALEGAFRREFLNRIDRVVVFRSLDRTTLRAVLHKELDLVLQRRGLRHRRWAVEWDETALQFLLEQGYSPELGARPLRRAIERHVLAPLAAAIVSDRVPEGDHFLFVRSDGQGVQVEFVDPDAPAPAPRRESGQEVVASLRALAREGSGSPGELAVVTRELTDLSAQLTEETWTRRKADAYAAMNEADFWSRPDRHRVLGLVELLSRVETAVKRAQERAGAAAAGCTRNDLRTLAARTLLLRIAVAAVERGEAQDAYVSVSPIHDAYGGDAVAAAFAREVVAMYEGWARLRRMQWRVLDDRGGVVTAAVSGFGAWSILAPETGLHVLDDRPLHRPSNRIELDGGHGDGAARPVHVRVVVAAQPPDPGEDGELALALSTLRAAQGPLPVVVRRYRREPSAEARDRVRGWRTGRLDRVLAGEFDLIE
ncbi:MAG: AAA family ATPase [Planctomycetota bacterium]